MRMTLRNLWTELWPRMRLGSITLIRNLKRKACSGSIPCSPTPKTFKRVSTAGQMMASIFWNNQGEIMVDYLEEGRTKDGAYYAKELRLLHQEIVRKRRGKLTLGVRPLQNTILAHTSQVVMAAATGCGFEVLLHHPYSTDLAPSDFYLFPKLKTNICGRNVGSNEGATDAINEHLGDQDEDVYFIGISKLEQRWRKCIKMKADYIEK